MQPILVLCDDYWHPAKTPRSGLAALPQTDFTFDWIENAHDWSAAQMASYPAVILTKSNNVSAADRTNWMTNEVQAAFVDYVRRGVACWRSIQEPLNIGKHFCCASCWVASLNITPSSAQSR